MAIHRGLTADRRRELRRQQLIEAALDTIAEDGVRNLRVRGVSGRARLNDRYFYESFRDCQELLLAAFDDQFASAVDGIMNTLADAPLELEPRARTILEFAFAFLDEDPRRSRLLIEMQTTEALVARRQQVIGVLARIVAEQIRELIGDRAGSDGTVTLTALTVSTGLLELAAQWYRRQIDVSQAELIDFATALVLTATDIAGALERRLAPPTV